MEEKIQLIKNNLTGDFSKDISILDSLFEEQNNIIENANATIEAINIVLKELKEEQEKVEKENKEKHEEIQDETSNEIDAMIDELLNHIDQESDDEALKSIEELIPKIENLTKSDDNVLYCSFKSEFEKILFEKIFAGEKEVRTTPYANDTIYIIYANLLLNKKRRTKAMEALDRAIYWNFLSREAREKKLEIYYSRKEIVKYLENIKLLQMISYTPIDIADCYNKYAFVFNELKDTRATYAMYKLSYSFYSNDAVANIISEFEKSDESLAKMTPDEIIQIATDNEVLIGANTKIIKAHRDITTELIQNGLLDQAKILLENDYAMTNSDEIAQVYNKLLEIEKNNELDNKQEKEETASEPKKKSTTKKSTSTKTKGKKETSTKKTTAKKTSTKKVAAEK